MNKREVTLIRESNGPMREIPKRAFRNAAALAVAGIFSVSIGCAAQPKKVEIANSASIPVKVAAPEPEEERAKPEIVEENPYAEKGLKPELKECPY